MKRRKKERFTIRISNNYCNFLLKDMSQIDGFDRKNIEGSLDSTLSMAIDRLGEYEDKDINVKKR